MCKDAGKDVVTGQEEASYYLAQKKSTISYDCDKYIN